MNKAELRARMRLLKRQLTDDEIMKKSSRLAARFLETKAYRQAESLYGYLPFNQEVRTMPILARALLDGKRVALPKVYPEGMRFVWVTDLTQVTRSPLGCPEPVADEPAADDRRALVLMPGLAFDEAGHRIGYGGGYYDRFLSREPEHPTVALCFDFQVLPELPVEATDVPAELVLWE